MDLSLIIPLLANSTKVTASDIGIPSIAADQTTWQSLVGGVFIFIGGFALLFIIIGAIRYVVSGGDPKATQDAKNTILYAVIGLVVSILAFSIVQFVIGKVSGA